MPPEGMVSAPSSAPVQNAAPTQNTPPAQGGNTPPAQSQKAEHVKAPEEFEEIKVNGKTVKLTKQELRDRASMSFAAQQKFDEAAKMRKEYESKTEKYSKDPLQAFLDHANSLPPEQRRKLIEDYYMREYIEPESLTQDQKKIKEYEARLKKFDEDEKQKKEDDEKTAQEKLTAHEREHLQGQIIEAMEKSGLPKTKFFVSRMAFYMSQNATNGWDAPIDMIVKQVKNERQSIFSDIVQGSSVDQLIEMFGEEGINKIRAHDLKNLREKRQAKTPEYSNAGTGRQSENSGDKVSSSEVNRRLRDMRLGKF